MRTEIQTSPTPSYLEWAERPPAQLTPDSIGLWLLPPSGVAGNITISELHIHNSAAAGHDLATIQVVPLMWTYIIGPLLALLPTPWRNSLPFAGRVNWGRATALSGLAESLGAIVALGYWYMYGMTWLVDRMVSARLSGKLGENVTLKMVGGAALGIWAVHPLTLLLVYCMFEGGARFCVAAFGDQNPGILPLALIDWIFFRRSRPQNPASVRPMGSVADHARSLVDAVRERILLAREGEQPDELRFRNEQGEDLLEIRASRRKPGWDPPRVVRMEDAYYRLEAFANKTGPRPFLYTLRRLSAGVPGSNVLIYFPPEALGRH